MSRKSEDLRKQAEEAGERADKSKSLGEAVAQRKRKKGLTQLADNEDWLEGKKNNKDA